MDCCQKHILTPIFKEEIPSHYPNNLHCVMCHQYKAPSHTSKSTVLIFEKMRNETEIEAISFKCIPPKSSDVYDVSPNGLLCIWTFKTSSFHAQSQNFGWVPEDCEREVELNQS